MGPKPCTKFVTPSTGGFDNAENNQKTFYLNENFNAASLVCSYPKFHSEFGFASDLNGKSSHEKITCDADTWTAPNGKCLELSCPDPRAAGVQTGFYGPSLNLIHTCSSLDQIKFLDETTYKNIADMKKLSGTSEKLDFADVSTSNFMPYKFPFDDQFLMTTENGENVVEGTKYRAFCKKGFSPFYNADIAMENGSSQAMANRYFDCECKMGKWVCSHHCRCDGFCE